MDKTNLRKKYKELRAILSPDEIDSKSIQIANNVLKLDIWDHEYYHIFLPIATQKEVDTSYILSILQGKDKHIIISKSNFKDTTMKNYLLTDNTKLVVNSYGIPEPENGIEISYDKIDVVFIPLLAYDTLGNRIGYGKGFYDRFLAQCKPGVIKVGLSFFEPELREIRKNDEDIPLNICVSDIKTRFF